MSPETEKRSRRRGRGSLLRYQTKAGERWKYQIYVPVDPDQPELGQRRLTRGGFLTGDKADEALHEAISKRRNDERFHCNIPTLTEYGNDWLDSLHLQPSTIDAYRRQFSNYLAPTIGNKPIDKITAPAIGKLYKQLRESGGKDGDPLSANTVNKVSIELASILDAAVEDGFINRNPARLKKIVKAPTGRDIRAEKQELVTWSVEELRSFLAWDRDVYHDENYALWLTLARTGMRRGEAVALQWGDIDFKASRISIRRAADVVTRGRTKVPKSGKARVIDADNNLLSALKDHRVLRASLSLDLARPKAYAFGNDRGELRNPLAVSKLWSTRSRQASGAIPDLPRLQLHGLRHTHATLLLELGESPKIVQERLGHSSIAITMDTYSHVTPTMQRQAVDRFSALLDGS